MSSCSDNEIAKLALECLKMGLEIDRAYADAWKALGEHLPDIFRFLQSYVAVGPTPPSPKPPKRPSYYDAPWVTGVCQYCGGETAEGRDPGPRICSSCNEELERLIALTDEEKAVDRAMAFLSGFGLPEGQRRVVSTKDVAELLAMDPRRVAEIMNAVLEKQKQAREKLRKKSRRKQYIE